MAQRLVFIVTEDWAFWRHRRPMARAARDAGFDVHLITNVSNRADAIRAEGFTVHALDMKRGSTSPADTLRSIRELRKRLTAIGPVLVHNVAVKPLVLGSFAALGLEGVAVVNSINGLGSAFISTTLRGRILKGGLESLLRILLSRRNVRTIVQNPEDFEAVTATGVPRSQLVLVPGSGVDCDVLTPLPEPALAPVRIAFVGRMLEDKGLRSLMRAHRLLRSQGEQIELLLAGEPDLENPTSITRADLEAWGSEPLVRWLGHVEDIRDVWEQAHIAVLPSRGEGLPKCLLEAAACGRPSVATSVPGCREIVIDGETGRLVAENDDAALAAAIAELAHDPGKRLRMGRAARALTENRFSSADIGRQTVAVYRELLAAMNLPAPQPAVAPPLPGGGKTARP